MYKDVKDALVDAANESTYTPPGSSEERPLDAPGLKAQADALAGKVDAYTANVNTLRTTKVLTAPTIVPASNQKQTSWAMTLPLLKQNRTVQVDLSPHLTIIEGLRAFLSVVIILAVWFGAASVARKAFA